MRFAFAGTHHFGALVLSELSGAQAHMVAVVTRPDKPRGRHGTPQPSEVKETALARTTFPCSSPSASPAIWPPSCRAPGAGALAVCAHGAIVPQQVLDAILTLVTHPSAVPRWRGAAPVERALMNGETELAVATLRMTAGVDEGPVGDLRPVHVPREADAGEAYALLAAPAAEGLLATLAAVEDGSVIWRPQEGEPTYAPKLEKADRRVRWGEPAVAIVDRVRALSPAIGARAPSSTADQLVLWRARALAEPPEPASRGSPGPGRRRRLGRGAGDAGPRRPPPAGGRLPARRRRWLTRA